MVRTDQIAQKVKALLALAVRTEDARARDILIELACQYQALAERVSKRERARQQDNRWAA
jgi:deoxyadenosine/deoxycytidine kinase